MADNKEAKKEPNNGEFDQSFLDPRLRSDSAETSPGKTQAQPAALGLDQKLTSASRVTLQLLQL